MYNPQVTLFFGQTQFSKKDFIQSPNLEKIIITFCDSSVKSLLDCRINRFFASVRHGKFDHALNVGENWFRKPAAFIDSSQFSDNVIVESIEADEECADARWESENARFRNRISFEETVFECTNAVLFILACSV